MLLLIFRIYRLEEFLNQIDRMILCNFIERKFEAAKQKAPPIIKERKRKRNERILSPSYIQKPNCITVLS